MSNKDHIPTFFLCSAFILIFVSLLFPWIITENLETGAKHYTYGGEEWPIIVTLILAFIPMAAHLYKNGITKIYLLIPFIESWLFIGNVPRFTFEGIEVRYGYGIYIWFFGLLFQFIGIIIVLRLKYKQSTRKNEESSDAPPTDRSEQVGEYR